MTSTINTRNTRYFLPNRILKEKRQYRNGCTNQKRKQSHSKRKKNISKRINTKTS